MIGTAAHIRRTLGCIAGATIVGLPVELLYFQVWHMNIDVLLHEWPLIVLTIALPLFVGLGAAIGLEGAVAHPPQTAGRIPALDRSIDVASLILLGILCGGLMAALIYGGSTDVMVQSAIALAFLAFGVAAARTLVRRHMYDTKAMRVAPFCAILGLLYALGMVTGATLARAITYQPPMFHSWSIDLPPWPILLLTTSLTIGLPVGIWLALTLWLALILGRRAASQLPTAVAL